MKYGIVYAAMFDGEIMFASLDKEDVENFVFAHCYKERQSVLDESGIDDYTEKDLLEAEFQAGYEGDNYRIVTFDLTDKDEDDMVRPIDSDNDYDEVSVSDILDKLHTDDEDEE